MTNKQLFRLALLSITSITKVLAQNAPTLRQGNTEIGFFAGTGYGLQVSGTDSSSGNPSVSVPSFHAVFGGDVGYAVTRSIFLVGEASYFPSMGLSIASSEPICRSSVNGVCQTTNVLTDTWPRRIVEFNAGVHYRLPVPDSRFVPYLAGGIGAAHALSTTVTESLSCSGDCNGIQTGTIRTSPLPGATAFEVAVGGGARLYLSEHVGFRGEFRFYHPFNVSNLGSFYRVSAGIFFQLK